MLILALAFIFTLLSRDVNILVKITANTNNNTLAKSIDDTNTNTLVTILLFYCIQQRSCFFHGHRLIKLIKWL